MATANNNVKLYLPVKGGRREGCGGGGREGVG